MSSVLVVRPSSLGDVVYALALVADIEAHRPGTAVDWVAEEAFVPLVRLVPGVRRVVPLAFRRWRKSLLSLGTWREFADFRAELVSRRYEAILDLQEQVKGALVARLARGIRHGLDRQSIREPVAAWFDDVHHRIDRDLHFVDKCRGLAAAALGYVPQGPPRWRFELPAPPPIMPPGPYAMVFHATSRADKLWPEANWRELLANFTRAGLTVLLPWGSADEEARSRRLAEAIPGTLVPPRQTLASLAALAGRAEIVVGVDTGLTHLAAALGTPTLALFMTTDPALAGVARIGAQGEDLGGPGRIPDTDVVLAASGRLLGRAPRC